MSGKLASTATVAAVMTLVVWIFCPVGEIRGVTFLAVWTGIVLFGTICARSAGIDDSGNFLAWLIRLVGLLLFASIGHSHGNILWPAANFLIGFLVGQWIWYPSERKRNESDDRPDCPTVLGIEDDMNDNPVAGGML